jgi:beta-hydroxylase
MVVAQSDTSEVVKKRRKRLKKLGKRLVHGVNGFIAKRSLVPERALMDPADFAWTATLQNHYPVIRRELEAVLAYRDHLPRLHDLQAEQYRISADDKWKTFVLCGWGHQPEEAMKLCPESVKLVKDIPGLQTAFFSVLAPGAHIPEHRGLVKSLLRGQLALKVPEQREGCVIRIDGQRYTWEEGKMLIFDDTYYHEVRNQTDQERIVLLLHFERPMTWSGRLAHRTLMFVMKRTGFVKKAKRRHDQWERDFRNKLQEPDRSAGRDV